jgi:hypothetical protein
LLLNLGANLSWGWLSSLRLGFLVAGATLETPQSSVFRSQLLKFVQLGSKNLSSFIYKNKQCFDAIFTSRTPFIKVILLGLYLVRTNLQSSDTESVLQYKGTPVQLIQA